MNKETTWSSHSVSPSQHASAQTCWAWEWCGPRRQGRPRPTRSLGPSPARWRAFRLGVACRGHGNGLPRPPMTAPPTWSKASDSRCLLCVTNLSINLSLSLSLSQSIYLTAPRKERPWRRLARAPQAVAGRPVSRPGSAEPPIAVRRALRRRRSRAGALPVPRGRFAHAAPQLGPREARRRPRRRAAGWQSACHARPPRRPPP
jgi:hypothetical protein